MFIFLTKLVHVSALHQRLAKGNGIINSGLDQSKFRSVIMHPLGLGEGPVFADRIAICPAAEWNCSSVSNQGGNGSIK